MVKRTVLVVIGLALLLPALACADVLDQVQSDFKAVSGVVVTSIGEEYLIDLDASRGVMVGDLVSVVVSGAPVLHPVTGEQLGTLDRVKGVLQVTEVRSGYSITRALSPEATFDKGEIVRRYTRIKTAFLDYSDSGQGLYDALRAALPTLDWQNYTEAQDLRPETPEQYTGVAPTLLFIYQNSQLEVRGAGFQLLHRYDIPVGRAAPAKAAITSAAPVSPQAIGTGVIVAAAAAAPPQGGIVHAEKQDWQGVRTVEDISSEAVGVEVGDFDNDGQLETAILDDTGVTLYRFTASKQEKLANVSLSQADDYLSIDLADIDANGQPEIYLSAVKGVKPAGLRLEFQDGELKVTQTDIPYFLRAVDLPDTGRTLLGQEDGNKSGDFARGLYRMQLKKTLLSKGERFPATWKVNLFGFTPLVASDGQMLYANLSVKNRLRVLQADGEELWQSSQEYGGSQISFRRPDFSGGAGDSEHDVTVMPRIEAGPGSTILVPSNAGKGVVIQMSNLGPGSIYAMQWDGSGLREVWHTRPQEGCLTDFRLADIDNDGQQELVLLMVLSTKGLFSKGRAALVIYELQ